MQVFIPRKTPLIQNPGYGPGCVDYIPLHIVIVSLIVLYASLFGKRLENGFTVKMFGSRPTVGTKLQRNNIKLYNYNYNKIIIIKYY